MSEKASHKFINPDYFNLMRCQHLNKIQEELEKVVELMTSRPVSEVIDAKKEVYMSTISFLLRRCDELGYISLEDSRFELNSVLHAHLVAHMDNGSILFKSDDDLKKERTGVLVNREFVNNLLKKVENWKIETL